MVYIFIIIPFIVNLILVVLNYCFIDKKVRMKTTDLILCSFVGLLPIMNAMCIMFLFMYLLLMFGDSCNPKNIIVKLLKKKGLI